MYQKHSSFARMMIFVGLLAALLSSCDAFAPTNQLAAMTKMTSSTQHMLQAASISDLSLIGSADAVSSSSLELSAATLDPTTILSDVFGLFIGTPIILLVPIVAALGVAGVLAWGIVAYANPEVEDDEI